MISEAFNPSHSRFFGAMMTESSSLVEVTFWNLRRILIRTGESSVVDFMLFVPEAWVLRLWWATAWHSYFTSLTWKCKLWTKSTANSANHSAKKWENGDKQSHNSDTIWQNVALNATEEWNWKDKNQKYWNIAWNKYKVKKVGKSNCTASLQKGGQIGGGESGGSPEIICEENFYQNGLNLVSTHGRFQWYPIFPAQNFLWLSNWPSKLKSHFFRYSFSQPTSNIKLVGEPD